MLAEIGTSGRLVALRADLDALPVDDLISDPWTSTIPGRRPRLRPRRAHRRRSSARASRWPRSRARGLLPGRVRLLFQPAEEVMPGGALHLISAGALEGVSHVFGLHCDPSLDVGRLGLREGPLTGAADALTVRLIGKGGHTSRPHLTEDLTFALGKVITELPAILSRRLDPRAGVSVVWGMVRAGSAHNVIPHGGVVAGTVRMLDAVAWADAEHLIRQLITSIVAPYSVTAEVTYQRGVPPVVNHAGLHRPARHGRSTASWARTATSPPPRASAARTSAGTSTPSPARWPASAPARPADRRTTSTRATSASTRPPPASRARVLAEAAVTALSD